MGRTGASDNSWGKDPLLSDVTVVGPITNDTQPTSDNTRR